MLVPAILHKEQIKKEFQKHYYTTDMLYETGGIENWIPQIAECPESWQFQYAIVDNNKKLIGYLGYSVDWYVSKVYNFGLFSFDRGNRGYDRFIKKHNGNKHILKDSIKDKSGKYHDDIIYEIVSEE